MIFETYSSYIGIAITVFGIISIFLLIAWFYTQVWNKYIGKKQQSFWQWALNKDVSVLDKDCVNSVSEEGQ